MNHILASIKQEQKVLFRKQIKDYYERERKYDVMPIVRILPKGKYLEYHKKLLQPLQHKEKLYLPSTSVNKSMEFKRDSLKEIMKFDTIEDINCSLIKGKLAQEKTK